MGTILSRCECNCVSSGPTCYGDGRRTEALIRCLFSRYMVDAADLEKMEASRNELHSLLDKPQLAGIPVLVLGNKRDLPGALDETGLIERM